MPEKKVPGNSRRKSPVDATERLAAKIARDLFVNGARQRAKRLVLTSADGRDLGGWGEAPMAHRILTLLRRHAPPEAK